MSALIGGWDPALLAFEKPAPSPHWHGRPIPMTPFDLKVIASGLYGFEAETPKAGPRSIQQIFDQAAGFQYRNDNTADDWQEPSVTEKLKAGDCEDMAVWVYRELKRNGYPDVRIMVGKFEAKDKDYHTWCVCSSADGDDFIVDPALQRRVWKRSELLPEVYIPYYSFDGQTKYTHRESSEPL